MILNRKRLCGLALLAAMSGGLQAQEAQTQQTSVVSVDGVTLIEKEFPLKPEMQHLSDGKPVMVRLEPVGDGNYRILSKNQTPEMLEFNRKLCALNGFKINHDAVVTISQHTTAVLSCHQAREEAVQGS